MVMEIMFCPYQQTDRMLKLIEIRDIMHEFTVYENL